MGKYWLFVSLLISTIPAWDASAQIKPDSTYYYFRNDNDPKSPFYILTGNIKDETGQGLSGVSVLVDGNFTGRVSDERGIYYVQVDSGEHRITFRHLAYIPTIYRVGMYGHGLLNTQLNPKTLELDEITVVAEGAQRNVNNPIAGINRITAKELNTLPNLMGEADVIRSLELLPGVTSVGEGSAGLNVRGGQSDQNLILLNEALVLSTNHALGFLSSFNPDIVDGFSLYKGNIPASFGGRSSAALQVSTKKGDFLENKTELSLGTSANRILSSGPLVKDKISYLAAGRLSNANWLLRRTNNPELNTSRLSFYDLYTGFSWKINQNHNIDFNTLYTADDFLLANDFGFEWSNLVTSISSRSLISPNLSILSTWAYGNFDNSYYETDPFTGARLRNGMEYLQGKVSAFYTYKNHSLTLGAEMIRYDSKPEIKSFNFQNVFSPIPDIRVDKESGLESSPFASLEWNPIKWISLVAGLRYATYRQLGNAEVLEYESMAPKTLQNIVDTLLLSGEQMPQYQGWEPRLALRISLSEHMSVKSGYSRTYQYIQSISNTTGPTPIDLWQLSNFHIQPQVSDNYSLGYFLNLKDNTWSLSLDLFYRNSLHQIDYRDFANLVVNPHLETELVPTQAVARGVELMVKKNKGNWTGWLAYTFSRTLQRSVSSFAVESINNGNWFPANWDRPHVGTLVLSRKLWQGGSFNCNINYSTGRPISGLNAVYIVNNRYVPLFSDRNEFRIPDYFRIDISYTTGSLFIPFDDSLTLGIFNLLGRRNAYSVFYQPLGTSSRLVPYQLSLLGTVLPSISYKVRF